MKKSKICIFPKIDTESNIQQILLREILEDNFKIIEGSWKSMLFKNYKLILINWPELFLYGEKRILKIVTFFILISKWRIFRVKHINIIHNPKNRLVAKESLVSRILLNSAHGNIHLNYVKKPNDIADIVIPNFHYISSIDRTKYNKESKYDAIAFGFLSKYKNLELVIDTFKQESDLKLLIAGKAESFYYRASLEQRIADSANIEIMEGFLQFEQLISKIFSSRIGVFLYSDIYNSAAVMLSLSCGKPVVVTKCEYAEELLLEIGHKWIFMVEKNASF